MTTPPAVAPPPGNPRFPLVDSVRAIAALSIFGLHSTVAFAAEPSHAVRLDIGVTIFFVISGFLLYRPFVAARHGRGRAPGMVDYVRARALRILPAYWLALTVLAVYPGLRGVFTHEGWHYYLLLQQYFPASAYGGLSQAWSLCVEVSFYAALPLLALAGARVARGPRSLTREACFLASLYAGAILFRLLVTGGDAPRFGSVFDAHFTLVPGSIVTVLFGTLDWFVLGMALALLSVALESRPVLPRLFRSLSRVPSLAWLVAAGLFVVAVQLRVLPVFPTAFTGRQWHASQILYGVVAVLVLAPAVLATHRHGFVQKVLANRVLSWLGLISYGIFLWHVAIIDALDDRFSANVPGPVLVAASFAITVACASASYYALERPLLRLKYRRPRGGADPGSTARPREFTASSSPG